MRIQLEKLVTTPNGKPIKINDADQGGTPVTKDLTVRLALESALSVPLEEDIRHGTKRFLELGDMLKALSDAKDEIDFKAEQISLIKDRMPHAFRGNPQIVWGCLQACEGYFNDKPASSVPAAD